MGTGTRCSPPLHPQTLLRAAGSQRGSGGGVQKEMPKAPQNPDAQGRYRAGLNPVNEGAGLVA